MLRTILITLALLVGGLNISKAQTNLEQSFTAPVWTEADKKYLLDNLIRTRQGLIDETKSLTRKQWNFKESADRWSINQIIEHLALWEILFMHEISQALVRDPDPNFKYAATDSVFLDQDPKGLKHSNALDYTKPFSFTIPLGNNEGKNNINWLMTMRNESIDYLENETKNIRQQYDYCSGANVHQYFLMIFSHTDRHLSQIRKVKTNLNYPK